jgi:hypothetical protein
VGQPEPSRVTAATHAAPSFATVGGTDGERKRDGSDTVRHDFESSGPTTDSPTVGFASRDPTYARVGLSVQWIEIGATV